MSTAPFFPALIFYDGSCPVCSREVEHYLQRDQGGKLQAIDISAPNFDPKSYGIPLPSLMTQLHVIDRKGNLYLGVEAFWAIWQAFPDSVLLRLLGKLVACPFIKPLARLIYRIFADYIRPRLPKNRRTCGAGGCCIDRRHG